MIISCSQGYMTAAINGGSEARERRELDTSMDLGNDLLGTLPGADRKL